MSFYIRSDQNNYYFTLKHRDSIKLNCLFVSALPICILRYFHALIINLYSQSNPDIGAVRLTKRPHMLTFLSQLVKAADVHVVQCQFMNTE